MFFLAGYVLGSGCSRGQQLLDLDLEAAGYAADHLNYLCTNWTRPTPLPCKKAVDSWQPQWGKRFMIFSWWPPLPADYAAYAEAGFNLALLRGDTWANRAQEQAYAEGRGPEWHATHDGLFEAVMEESGQLAAQGVMSVFSQVNFAPDQKPRATQAYGNRTGGVVQGNTNLTKHSFQSWTNEFDTGSVRSYMSTIPEERHGFKLETSSYQLCFVSTPSHSIQSYLLPP
jgi:hypothetical protein